MTTDDLTIRAAGPEDRDTVRKVGRETYVEHFSAIWSPPAMDQYLEQEFSPQALAASLAAADAHQWCLAFGTNDEAVGFSKVNWSRPDPVDGANGAELQKIYFRSSMTGKGYGSRLLAHVIEQAAERGESMIWLDVLESNLAAHRFYQRHGFLAVGEVVFHTDRGDIGMLVMKRTLA